MTRYNEEFFGNYIAKHIVGYCCSAGIFFTSGFVGRGCKASYYEEDLYTKDIKVLKRSVGNDVEQLKEIHLLEFKGKTWYLPQVGSGGEILGLYKIDKEIKEYSPLSNKVETYFEGMSIGIKEENRIKIMAKDFKWYIVILTN